MMSRVKHCLITFLVVHLMFPAPVIGAVSKTVSVALLPVVSDKTSIEGQLAMELAYSLSRDLGTTVNMITPDVLTQSNKTSNIPELSSGYLDLYKRFAAARNKFSLGGHVEQAIEALENLASEIIRSPELNRESAKLYESIQLSKAWIYYQDNQTERASQTIQSILSIKAGHDIDTLGYPAKFRKFITREKQNVSGDSAFLNITSRPSAVDVIVNGIYSGNSSMPISVPAGELHLSLATGGRKTVQKDLRLAPGEKRSIKATLPWKNDESQAPMISYSDNPFADLSLSSAVNQGIHADKIVFLGVQKASNGFQVFAKVYDQKFHQALATIKYPKTIRNVKTESHKLKQFISSKLRPYLSTPANQLWKGDYDQKINLDDRIALRPREPLYRKKAFWAAVGTVVVGGTILGIALSQGGTGSGGGDGSVAIDLGGFQGVRK